ncbi:hypothetical protein GLOTRDRAFT_135160 [Gloeophyllum trabeum ATCC 11539]|uniref:Mediator of RNA polymerase II transcription subunit 7 n=1 Tax=Gloeophyllum trabeum (strain ATCC 11539 / FP-39264 / Madison 617) TaxID=670483 RepID=S7RZQ1_GLOTA|nr:uncharacterized protein GLOTRDRAFT_135160 [Gloeophyllum trabeum ATCC 11539]EPQ60490.1 hypothetical protein GLOTRDRAFT_135160 [Gloeophyllum trabeum ATCC 11539]
MEDEEAELRNPFPSPPSHYTRYTSHNLNLLALLKERAMADDLAQVNQHALLSDQPDVPDWPLAELEKPRADWILEEGSYTVFGDTWFVKETIPSLAELGGHQLYPADPSADRRPALLGIVRSMLVSYSQLLNALLVPPPSLTSTEPPEWQKYVEWITVLAQNIMAAANDLRPVQARASLELMMQRQLELRKEETQALNCKCDELEAKLTELRNSARNASSLSTKLAEMTQSSPSTTAEVTAEDVLRWAEEIG